jgi:hypothetical protein
MPNFPVATLMDTVLGLDVHIVCVPAPPVPPAPIPHPYCGPVILWCTPCFPTCDIFANGKPVLCPGANGYFPQGPLGVPPNPTNMPGYWKRYLLNIPKAAALMMLTIFANIAIAGIAALIPKPKSVEKFITDVTGIDTTNSQTTWDTIKGSFSSLTNWSTWVKLLLPPMPYPIGNGSCAIGSPTVTFNGGPAAIACCPLMAISCTEMPWALVPNAVVMGSSNVLVGMSLSDMVRGIAVHSAQAGVSHAVSTGFGKLTSGRNHP